MDQRQLAPFSPRPFGGYKDSGVGCEESMEELLSYTQIKSINVMLECGQ